MLYIVTILICALISHGLLLLNDGVYWDGWLIYSHLADKAWGNLFQIFQEAGSPQTAYFHWGFSYLQDIVFGHKTVAFLSITFSIILIYLILDETTIFSKYQSLFIALITLAYPTWQAAVELIFVPYPFCYCLFFLGWYATIKNVNFKGIVHLFWRLLCYGIFLVSFTIQSLLVLYYGILVSFFIISQKKNGCDSKQGLRAKVWQYFDYLFLPVLFWILTNFFFAPQGLYKDYYNPGFSPAAIIDVYSNFFAVAIYGHIYYSIKLLFSYPFVEYYILSLFIFIFFICKFPSDKIEDYPIKGFLLKMLLGVGLLFLAIFPYAAIGLYATPYGWSTRHALLIALPVGIIVVTCFGFLSVQTSRILQLIMPNMRYINQYALVSKLNFFFISVLLLAFTLSTTTYYLTWQARWIKDRSIMTKLAMMPVAKKTSMFIVYDYFLIGSEPYRYYEWASLFKQIWGNECRIGVDFRHSPEGYLKNYKEYQRAKYNLKDFDPNGCQTKMTIHPGAGLAVNNIRNYVELTIRYFYYKYFIKSELRNFLLEVTKIRLDPIPISSSASCREL